MYTLTDGARTFTLFAGREYRVGRAAPDGGARHTLQVGSGASPALAVSNNHGVLTVGRLEVGGAPPTLMFSDISTRGSVVNAAKNVPRAAKVVADAGAASSAPPAGGASAVGAVSAVGSAAGAAATPPMHELHVGDVLTLGLQLSLKTAVAAAAVLGKTHAAGDAASTSAASSFLTPATENVFAALLAALAVTVPSLLPSAVVSLTVTAYSPLCFSVRGSSAELAALRAAAMPLGGPAVLNESWAPLVPPVSQEWIRISRSDAAGASAGGGAGAGAGVDGAGNAASSTANTPIDAFRAAALALAGGVTHAVFPRLQPSPRAIHALLCGVHVVSPAFVDALAVRASAPPSNGDASAPLPSEALFVPPVAYPSGASSEGDTSFLALARMHAMHPESAISDPARAKAILVAGVGGQGGGVASTGIGAAAPQVSSASLLPIHSTRAGRALHDLWWRASIAPDPLRAAKVFYPHLIPPPNGGIAAGAPAAQQFVWGRSSPCIVYESESSVLPRLLGSLGCHVMLLRVEDGSASTPKPAALAQAGDSGTAASPVSLSEALEADIAALGPSWRSTARIFANPLLASEGEGAPPPPSGIIVHMSLLIRSRGASSLASRLVAPPPPVSGGAGGYGFRRLTEGQLLHAIIAKRPLAEVIREYEASFDEPSMDTGGAVDSSARGTQAPGTQGPVGGGRGAAMPAALSSTQPESLQPGAPANYAGVGAAAGGGVKGSAGEVTAGAAAKGTSALPTRSELTALRVPELRSQLAALGIATEGMIEKGELVECLMQARTLHQPTHTDAPAAAASVPSSRKRPRGIEGGEEDSCSAGAAGSARPLLAAKRAAGDADQHLPSSAAAAPAAPVSIKADPAVLLPPAPSAAAPGDPASNNGGGGTRSAAPRGGRVGGGGSARVPAVVAAVPLSQPPSEWEGRRSVSRAGPAKRKRDGDGDVIIDDGDADVPSADADAVGAAPPSDVGASLAARRAAAIEELEAQRRSRAALRAAAAAALLQPVTDAEGWVDFSAVKAQQRSRLAATVQGGGVGSSAAAAPAAALPLVYRDDIDEGVGEDVALLPGEADAASARCPEVAFDMDVVQPLGRDGTKASALASATPAISAAAAAGMIAGGAAVTTPVGFRLPPHLVEIPGALCAAAYYAQAPEALADAEDGDGPLTALPRSCTVGFTRSATLAPQALAGYYGVGAGGMDLTLQHPRERKNARCAPSGAGGGKTFVKVKPVVWVLQEREDEDAEFDAVTSAGAAAASAGALLEPQLRGVVGGAARVNEGIPTASGLQRVRGRGAAALAMAKAASAATAAAANVGGGGGGSYGMLGDELCIGDEEQRRSFALELRAQTEAVAADDLISRGAKAISGKSEAARAILAAAMKMPSLAGGGSIEAAEAEGALAASQAPAPALLPPLPAVAATKPGPFFPRGPSVARRRDGGGTTLMAPRPATSAGALGSKTDAPAPAPHAALSSAAAAGSEGADVANATAAAAPAATTTAAAATVAAATAAAVLAARSEEMPPPPPKPPQAAGLGAGARGPSVARRR